MSDKYYLSVLWKMTMSREMDWNSPKTFNEKLQWLKIYDRNPLYTVLVDKYRVKQWITNKVGGSYVVPNLCVYSSVDEIDLERLPRQFVLKCNHDSGGIVICRDKASFNLETAKQRLKQAYDKSFYWDAREWPYKDVNRLILAEEYLGNDLQDYRIYCFNGNPRLVYSYTNKSEASETKPEPEYCDIFDCEWNPMPFHQKSLPRGGIEAPGSLKEMMNIARELSKGIPFVRIDFYLINNRPVIGEMTLFPGGGFSVFVPEEWDRFIGEWLHLPID